MDSLYEYINKFNDQTEKKILLEASFADMNNSFEEKLLKSPGKKCPVDTSSCFSFRIIGDRVETNGPCMHDYLDKLYTVEDMSFERSSIQKTHKKNSRSSSTSLQSKENIIRISSCKDFLTLANSTSNFQLFDYQDCLKEIITIQSI